MLRNYDGKCLFMGDFNLVLSREEKERGVWNATCQNRVWNKWMRLHSLNLNVVGDYFTWFVLQQENSCIW